jgi:malonyl CoA-acyl carrier protein transacylase
VSQDGVAIRDGVLPTQLLGLVHVALVPAGLQRVEKALEAAGARSVALDAARQRGHELLDAVLGLSRVDVQPACDLTHQRAPVRVQQRLQEAHAASSVVCSAQLERRSAGCARWATTSDVGSLTCSHQRATLAR